MSLNSTVRQILESKIHQSFSVAADELALRGYLSRDERITISNVIGDVLDNFGAQLGTIGQIPVDSFDVSWIASLKAGVENIKRKHDGIQVFKDARRKLRWISFSSNAFQDHDREIVSLKALEEDCYRADQDGEYGPLRWWHVPGLDIGVCDFNMMHGRILIESGTFYNERIGARVKEQAQDLQVSLGFLHPVGEPQHDGVYRNIRRFERSLLPHGSASNFLTAFS